MDPSCHGKPAHSCQCPKESMAWDQSACGSYYHRHALILIQHMLIVYCRDCPGKGTVMDCDRDVLQEEWRL